MSIQEKGTLPDQRSVEYNAIHGSGQVLNNEGGFVHELDDMKQLERYVILGCDGNKYYANSEDMDSKNITCIKRIIENGQGPDAVSKIKMISEQRQNLCQKHLLNALATLARSGDETTKEKAYESILSVCRIPTHLFLFIKYCEVASRRASGGKGWGRAHKRAINLWYTSFAQKPMKLARLVSKYKRREDTSHKDVMRLAHPNGENLPPPIAFIVKYIVKQLDEAKRHYIDQLESSSEMKQVAEYLSACDSAMSSSQPEELCYLISKHKLSREHCQTGMLNNKYVWCALLPHMHIEALIRNLGKMTRLGLFETNSKEEEMTINKINSINMEAVIQDGEEEAEMDQELSWQHGYGRHVNVLHPYQILIGWMNYKQGHGQKGKGQWTPNPNIVAALEKAFYKAFQTVERTGKKHFLAVHMSGNMTQPAFWMTSTTIPFDYTHAAATMMMVTVRTEDDVIVKGLSDQIFDLHINDDDDLDTVIKKSFPVAHGGSDCSLPMKHAIEQGMRDIDVFVLYTDSETVSGNVHAGEALRQYREFSSNPDVKLVVCGMSATEFTIAEPDDSNMLDIVGFDAAAPRIISQFVQGF